MSGSSIFNATVCIMGILIIIIHAVSTQDAVKSQSIDMADEMLTREKNEERREKNTKRKSR